MDNSYSAMVEVFLKQGGEYRKLPYKLEKKPLCDFFKGDVYYYEELSTMSTFPFPFVCPYKKVSFLILKFVIALIDMISGCL